ncbi:L-serine ammonia-lyase [Granulicella arctica]|uniref:L-serine ammonia-lyase n=1 Tax=Granulicella arctica TaxID=940613 RepID=UPI0021E06BF9|nr:L-serine ammonia-lyase [Granulicella arctica]
MNTSLFELFKIGIGPSSSHTVGPMRAALRFVQTLTEADLLQRTSSITVDLYGSLALTGIGHGTDGAILLGLLGEAPDTIDSATIPTLLAAIRTTGTLTLGGTQPIRFVEAEHLHFNRSQMYPTPGATTHPNGVKFSASDSLGTLLSEGIFYSIGGGFILSQAEYEIQQSANAPASTRTVPYPFASAHDLLTTAATNSLTIAELLLANECALLSDSTLNIKRPAFLSVIPDGDLRLRDAPTTSEDKIRSGILALWQVMRESTERGIATEGILPGGLNVRRRAHRLAERLNTIGSTDPLAPIDWVTVFAMAVNEENAAGGRVVTAPTNGAAGVIPAIAHYYLRFTEGSAEEKEAGLIRYFLTAAAIGILYKENASISGAEVGCQGEVGVACSMAAGGLVAALNGTNAQIEHAAEIAMEHNLGMTCDPIGGLVQIPCIERNGMGAVKAINASRMAMHETGDHKLSLDQVIATMYQTGLDMQSRYKETSLAGLALNIIEC